MLARTTVNAQGRGAAVLVLGRTLGRLSLAPSGWWLPWSGTRLMPVRPACQAAGLAIRREAHTSRVPRSQRGGDIVEPLVREQWFVRMEPLAQPALQARLTLHSLPKP